MSKQNKRNHTRPGRKGPKRGKARGKPDIMRNPSKDIIPYRFATNVDYVYTYLNATAIPGFYDWVLKGNGLYDPDIAIGGNSAYGLNEMSAIYDSYKVLGSTIKVTAINLDVSNPAHLAVIPTQFSASFAAAQQDGILHHPKARAITVDRYDGARVLKNACSTAIAMDVKDVDDIGFQAVLTADPVHLWYWHVVTWNNGGAAANIELTLEIKYKVMFSVPHPMTI